MRFAIVEVGKMTLPAFQRDDRGSHVFELLKALHESQVVLKVDEAFASTVSDLFLNVRAVDSLANILTMVKKVANDPSSPLEALVAELAALDVDIPLESRNEFVEAAGSLREWLVEEGFALHVESFVEAVGVHRQLSTLAYGTGLAPLEVKWSALLTAVAQPLRQCEELANDGHDGVGVKLVVSAYVAATKKLTDAEFDDDKTLAALRDLARGKFQVMLPIVGRKASALLQRLGDDLDNRVGELEQIAGGANAGSSWHEGLAADGDGLAHAKKSLLDMDTLALPKLMAAVTAASAMLDHSQKFFQDHLPDGQFTLPSSRSDSKAVLSRANTTRHEWLLASTLDRPASSKFMSRLRSYSATLASEEARPWKDLVCPALAAQVQAKMDDDKEANKKKRKGADDDDGEQNEDKSDKDEKKKKKKAKKGAAGGAKKKAKKGAVSGGSE